MALHAYSVGSLVRARGRSWVVLPDDPLDPELIMLRPLGGTDEEVTGIHLGLEPEVHPDQFAPPDPHADLGNHLSCQLLRDAVRLGFRSGAGPFRCLGHIAIEPRPYQLVPLLLALKLNPVRLLIADDVGIGKTIESCLIARELLDRGEIRRMTVLCPPHLAEQWQRALRNQFHLDAELVLSTTVSRLEKDLLPGESVFERYPITIVSTDYIKRTERRDQFLRTCPEFVIVDEAHGCAETGGGSASQQRHELLQDLVKDPARHLLLVTATPHSGHTDAFRSLVTLLDPGLGDLPADLSGEANRKHRENLARFLVQRRRADLETWLQADTPFPKRLEREQTYKLHSEYREFIEDVLAWCRKSVLDPKLSKHRQRVRWWSAIALLRSIGSSPAAAVATLRNRASYAELEAGAMEAEARRTVLDEADDLAGEDVVPGMDLAEEEGEEGAADSWRRGLLRLAKQAESLAGKDRKLDGGIDLIAELVAAGHAPIVFCRFIPTVDYLAQALRKDKRFKGVEVAAVDGTLPGDEREARVAAMGGHAKRVLVCTDCLSEGIDLQEHFDTVVHYDMVWNPTRHEQREGRVDRYGQQKATVGAVTWYGSDNPIDGLVFNVLLRRHKAIRESLGVSVPLPVDAAQINEAIFEGLLLRENGGSHNLRFDFMDDVEKKITTAWHAAEERERKSRTLFAQQPIERAVQAEVTKELTAVRKALGSALDVERFVRTALRELGAAVGDGDPVSVDLRETPPALRDALANEGKLQITFQGRPRGEAQVVGRTHPVVENLAAYVLEAALDPQLSGVAKRCGVVRTAKVERREIVLLLRVRFHLGARDREGVARQLLAEDQLLVAFAGHPEAPEWQSAERAEELAQALPEGNLDPAHAREMLVRLIPRLGEIAPHLERVADDRGRELLDAHRRVRQAAHAPLRGMAVERSGQPDILGVFVYVPARS